MNELRRRGVALALLLAVVLVLGAAVPPADATTVLDAYQQLKGQPEYNCLMQELVATGKVTETQVDDFVRDLSGRIYSGVSRDDFENEFISTGIAMIIEEQYAPILDACAEVFADDWNIIKKAQLPPSLYTLKDAFIREMFGEKPSGGGGGGGGGSSSSTSPPVTAPEEQDQPPAAEEPLDGSIPCVFTDICGHWAEDAIQTLAEKGIVKGVSENTFAPESQVTRAEFAVLLTKSLGIAESPAAGELFGDVDAAAWYASAVESAAAAGLIKGCPDGTFKPQAAISRQEMAVMIAGALRHQGSDDSLSSDEVNAVLGVFADNTKIDLWARCGAAVAVKSGIIHGRSGNSFAPLAVTTRAEAAVMLRQMLRFMGVR